jgi:hypothetical protein
MKISRIVPVAGILILLSCGAAFAQSPNQIPVGAGSEVDRQPAGSGWRDPAAKSPPAAAQPSATKSGAKPKPAKSSSSAKNTKATAQ